MRLQGKMFAAALTSAMAVAALTVPSATAAKPTITIWMGKDTIKNEALEKVVSTYKDANIVLVANDFSQQDLAEVAPEEAPDIIEGANDWTGALSSNGIIKAISFPAPVAAQFPKNDLSAFKYDGDLLGVPMQHESIAFVMNTDLAGKTCPATLDQAVARVQPKVDKGKLVTAIQVGGGDAYHWYPMMSGLGGAFFKQKANGEYTNKPAIQNTANTKKKVNIIKGWNASGLFQHGQGNGGVTGPFSKSKAAYFITGPWNSNAIRDLAATMNIKLCAFPSILPGVKSVPFSGVRGFMVTKYASTHGVLAAAKQFLITKMASSATQQKYCKLTGCNPSNKNAGISPNPFTAQFNVAAGDAVPMPNIPELAFVWSTAAEAWTAAMAEEDPTNPRTAFSNAAQTIRDAIAAG